MSRIANRTSIRNYSSAEEVHRVTRMDRAGRQRKDWLVTLTLVN